MALLLDLQARLDVLALEELPVDEDMMENLEFLVDRVFGDLLEIVVLEETQVCLAHLDLPEIPEIQEVVNIVNLKPKNNKLNKRTLLVLPLYHLMMLEQSHLRKKLLHLFQVMEKNDVLVHNNFSLILTLQ